MEVLKKIWKWVDHNQGWAFAMVIVIGLGVWVYGCESQVASLQNPAVMVKRSELVLELETVTASLSQQMEVLNAKAEIRFEELDKQDELKQKLFGLATESAVTGIIDPTKIIALVGWLLGVGIAVDNRSKDKVIKNRPLLEK